MAHSTKLGWEWHIRLKGNFLIFRRGRRRCKAKQFTPARGQANYFHHALSKGQDLISRLYLSGAPDPEPAMASRKQQSKRAMPTFRSSVTDFASVIYL